MKKHQLCRVADKASSFHLLKPNQSVIIAVAEADYFEKLNEVYYQEYFMNIVIREGVVERIDSSVKIKMEIITS